MEMTLAQLIEAYKVDGKLVPMHLDNDSVSVYRVHDADWLNVETVYESDPYDLLREALDLLGIPWENALCAAWAPEIWRRLMNSRFPCSREYMTT